MFLSKKRNKSECGTKREELGFYFSEFLWRRKFENEDPFETILLHISKIYKFE